MALNGGFLSSTQRKLPKGSRDLQRDSSQVPRQRGMPQVPRQTLHRHGHEGGRGELKRERMRVHRVNEITHLQKKKNK